MRRGKQIILCSIVIFMNLTLIFGFALLSSEVDLQITEDTVYYVVDDNGDLTIQINGILLGVEITETHFNLIMPQDFVVGKLENDSPIVELANEGRPKEKSIIDNNEFHSVFVVNTYASTLLPTEYQLTVVTQERTFVKSITPIWPSQDQISGGGASIKSAPPPYPYITAFYAYDSNKGTSEHVTTYIHNPSYMFEADVIRLKYILESNDYPNYPNPLDYWGGWTEFYSETGSFGPSQTYVAHDYIDYLLYIDNSWYALNTGTYEVLEVYVEGQTMGTPWNDEYNPPTWQGEFQVTINANWHPVFVLSLTSSVWRTTYGHDAAYYINQASDRFEYYFDIEIIPVLELSWEPSSSYTITQLLAYARSRAGALLDIGIWVDGLGCSKWNHGFDILAGFTGYRSNHCGATEDLLGNNLVCTRGNPNIYVYSPELDNLVQHELSHLFDARDRLDIVFVPPFFWEFDPNVMSKPTGFLSKTHWFYLDKNLIQSNVDHFNDPFDN